MIRAHTRHLVASATAFLVISTGGTALAAPAAPTATAPPATTAATTGSQDLRPISLPGLQASLYKTTLITGDEVTLRRTGGRYVVETNVAQRADGTTPAVYLQSEYGADSVTTSISAVPTDLQGLVAAGVVDRNAFDVLWMAQHAESRHTALAVTVKFGDGLDTETLNRYARALPGATVAATHQDTASVDLRIDAREAAQFWAALKPSASLGDLTGYLVHGIVPKLEHGVQALWPTGHRSPAAAPQGDTGQPFYDVTWTFKAPTNADRWYCGADDATMCLGDMFLLQVDGSAVGSLHQPIGVRCITLDPCTGYEAKFRVPAGTYHTGGFTSFRLDGLLQFLLLDIPELKVAGDASIVSDGNSAQRHTVETPKPSEAYDGTILRHRTNATGSGGTWGIDVMQYGAANFWEFPSAPVTVGTFLSGQDWLLGKPVVKMEVTKPSRFTLDAVAAEYWKDPAHFTGVQTLELVDGGLGRDEDLAKIDARGKLVMLQIDEGTEDNVGRSCSIGGPELNRAKAAGAVGVLVDAFARGGPFGTHVCPYLPIGPSWSEKLPEQVSSDLPYAAVTHAKAEQLRGLMSQETVKIEVTGSESVSPYVYNLHLYQQGRIPASLHTKLTDNDLAEVETTVHGSPSDQADFFSAAFRKNVWLAAGLGYQGISEGSRFTTYKGPVSPDLVRLQWNDQGHQVIEVVDRAGTSSPQRWQAQPRVPGAPQLSPKVIQAQPDKFGGSESYNMMAFCSFCRQGNTFVPLTHLVSGANPAIQDGVYVFPQDNVHLYTADGQEVPQTTDAFWGATYVLPEQANRYRLTGTNGAGTTTTAWTFTSSKPAVDQRPQGTYCLAGGSVDCHAEPLLFLRYDAGVDLNNAVTAGASHELKVTAYHQSPHTSPVTSLELSVSTDGGATWQPVKVRTKGGGDYAGSYRIPSLADTNGKVSIKAKAADADGNTVEQTVMDAFSIR